jgi:hypothetical protein
VANWAISAEDARLLQAAPVLVRVPAWFSGGNPAGIGPLAEWKIGAAPESEGWFAQNREAERGRPPQHFAIVKLGGKGDLQEVGFHRLRELTPFDQYTTTNLWNKAVGYYEELMEEHPGELEAVMTSVKTLLVAAHRAVDLPPVALQIMRNMVRPSLPDADMFLVKVDQGFHGRLAVPRALLRNLVEKPSEDPALITFQTSQQIIADTYIGMVPFIECLLTSLSPYVWGIGVGRAGGIVVITFGKPLFGRRPTAGSLLDLSAKAATPNPAPTWKATAVRRDFERAIEWWMSRLDLLSSHLTEPRNCAREAVYDPRTAHERIITAVQIFRSCHMLATTRDQHTRQLLLYNVLDQLGGINAKANWHATTKAKSVYEKLSQIRSRMPEDVQRVLLPRATAAAEALSRLADGFFAPELVTDDGILLPDSSGGQVRTPLENAASDWLRVMRNSAHGFEKQITDRQRTLLAAHNADIPVELPDLAWLHLLNLLCYPEQVSRSPVLSRKT